MVEIPARSWPGLSWLSDCRALRHPERDRPDKPADAMSLPLFPRFFCSRKDLLPPVLKEKATLSPSPKVTRLHLDLIDVAVRIEDITWL